MELKDYIKKLRGVKENLERQVTIEVGKTIDKLIREVFEKQVDPYGNKWAPLKDGSEFDKKRHIMNSFRYVSNGKNILIYSKLPYAEYHQEGTRYLPQRRMIPEGDLGNWKEEIDKAMLKGIKNSMR